MRYNSAWLQQEATRLGSWNKVCQLYGISPSTIAKYKKMGLISDVVVTRDVDLEKVQDMYDSGMSIHKISEVLNIPHSQFSKRISRRTREEARKLVKYEFSNEVRAKLSASAKQRGLGGYRPHPNKGQRYSGVWFDSNWEVQVAKSLDENCVSWIRPKTGFAWTDEGRKYYPDFFLPDFNVYLDPKNDYLIIKDKLKIDEAQKRNNIRVLVLTGKELTWQHIHDKIKSCNSSVAEQLHGKQ